MIHHRPHHLLLQWHISDRCNHRCSHCYQKSFNSKEPSLILLLSILQQYQELLVLWNNKTNTRPVRGHITLTGGEPFAHPDFLALLEIISKKKHHFSFSILSNGSFIDQHMAKHLAALKPRFVQISLEGNESTHDAIRGEGSFDEAVSALKYLVNQKITTLISFTAHTANFREFPDVVHLAQKLRVDRVWADRLVPLEAGSNLTCLSKEETYEFMNIMNICRNEALQAHSTTEVAMKRALQFFFSREHPYRCSAGDTLITIMPNGDLLPCRRMPIRVGNVTDQPLSELYDSPLFIALRDRNRICNDCSGCQLAQRCGGGLRCLSFAITGNPFQGDPGCWLIPEQNMQKEELELNDCIDIIYS
ncbi:MAG: radical SAM protein [bacterium]